MPAISGAPAAALATVVLIATGAAGVLLWENTHAGRGAAAPPPAHAVVVPGDGSVAAWACRHLAAEDSVSFERRFGDVATCRVSVAPRVDGAVAVCGASFAKGTSAYGGCMLAYTARSAVGR